MTTDTKEYEILLTDPGMYPKTVKTTLEPLQYLRQNVDGNYTEARVGSLRDGQWFSRTVNGDPWDVGDLRERVNRELAKLGVEKAPVYRTTYYQDLEADGYTIAQVIHRNLQDP